MNNPYRRMSNLRNVNVQDSVKSPFLQRHKFSIFILICCMLIVATAFGIKTYRDCRTAAKLEAAQKEISNLRMDGIRAQADRDWSKAESLYAKALEQSEKYGTKMDVIEFRSRLAQAKIKNGELLSTKDLVDKAVVLALKIKNTREGNSNIFVWLEDMANAFYAFGERGPREDVKEFCLERYADIKLSVYDHFERFPAARAFLLISRLTNTERYNEALPYQEKLSHYYENTMSDLGFVGYSYLSLGSAYLAVHKFAEAEAAFKKGRELHRKHGSPDKIVEGTFTAALGTVKIEEGDLKRAADLYEKAIALDKPYFSGRLDSLIGQENTILGIVQMRAGKYGEAVGSFEEALHYFDKCRFTQAEKAKHADSAVNAGQVICYIRLSQIISALGMKPQAKSLKKRAQDLCNKHAQWSDSGNKLDFDNLEHFYILHGDFPNPVDMLPTHIRISF